MGEPPASTVRGKLLRTGERWSAGESSAEATLWVSLAPLLTRGAEVAPPLQHKGAGRSQNSALLFQATGPTLGAVTWMESVSIPLKPGVERGSLSWL